MAADGTATLPIATLPIGSDIITATYNGDANFGASVATTITETVAPPPTLVPAISRSTLPASLVAGFAAHGIVVVNITNVTAATLKGKATLQLFASSSGAIDGSSILLAHSLRPVNLRTTRALRVSLSVRITAAELPVGNYTLLARVIDLSGNNNDTTTGPALAVAAPFISLSETLSRTTLKPSVIAGARSAATAVLHITNAGNITTPVVTTVALYLTANGTIDGLAIPINSITRPLRIRAKRAVNVTIPFKQIPAVVAGAYTVVALVTDSNGATSSVQVAVVAITAS